MADELIKIEQLTEKVTLVDDDEFAIDDSADLVSGLKRTKRVKAITIKTYTGVSSIISSSTNFIINPIDEGMIDQYLTSGSVANDVYVIDRWKVQEAGTNPTFLKNASSIRLTANATETNKISFVQIIKDINYLKLAGQEVTLSAKVTSNSSNTRIIVTDDAGGTFNVSSAHTGGGTEETLSVTFTVDSVPTSMIVYIGMQTITNGTLSITNANYVQFSKCQLTIGSTPLTYNARLYSDEELSCQKYYLKLTINDPYPVAYGFIDGSFYGFLPTPTAMVSLPSISITGGAFVMRGGTTFENVGVPTPINLSSNGITLNGTSSVIGNNNAVTLGIRTANAIIILDSEL